MQIISIDNSLHPCLQAIWHVWDANLKLVQIE